MDKTEYKNAFSQIHPSEKTVERIFEMTNKKYIPKTKALIAVIAVIALLFCAAITANAATDGAISDYVAKKAVKLLPEDVASMFSNIIINKRAYKTNLDKVVHNTATTPDGEEYDRYEYKDDNIKVTVEDHGDNLTGYIEIESATAVMETVD